MLGLHVFIAFFGRTEEAPQYDTKRKGKLYTICNSRMLVTRAKRNMCVVPAAAHTGQSCISTQRWRRTRATIRYEKFSRNFFFLSSFLPLVAFIVLFFNFVTTQWSVNTTQGTHTRKLFKKKTETMMKICLNSIRSTQTILWWPIVKISR